MTPSATFWDMIDQLVQESRLVIDRPKSSTHPRFPSIVYPVNYGYLEGTSSMDGGGIDVWVGTRGESGVAAIICTVDLLKRDSEIKILIHCTEDETQTILAFHNQHSMRGLLVRRQS
jgi:inorganic pyrophosphatase